MYELIILNSASKAFSKLDKPVRTMVLTALDKIAENPFIGDMLKGDLATIYSYRLKVSGAEYRIAYQVKKQEIVVVIMQIGTRENFYEELRKRFK